MAPGCQGVHALWWPLFQIYKFNIFKFILTKIIRIFFLICPCRGSLKVLEKVLYWSLYYLFEIMRKVEIDNVEEFLEKTVTKDGKVGGLKKHAGKKVIIVVTKRESK